MFHLFFFVSLKIIRIFAFRKRRLDLIATHCYLLQYVAFETTIVQWCNGSTPDFGSVSPGSSPGWTTKKDRCSHEHLSFFMIAVTLFHAIIDIA